ncbi:LysR family transcriptional regulator [Agrobacterium vitis]|uniref:HTH-type transcriptional regulator TtuA n=1 Tax=Agrobacterium vitis TaxID=373 RepID=A0AAE2RIT6_AGRVI|nr:LysR family transcriptional regulator [Agrobacterium vitis]MBF2717262.1 LysR family transcriptional regulator [Agrobacterium vitis]
MDLLELKAFVFAVQTGSITQAAFQLGRVQSSVSLRIKQLETELGVELLSRDRGGVRTTARGQILYDYATRILALAQEAKGEVMSPNTGEIVRLGTIETISPDCIDSLVRLLSGFDGMGVDVYVDGALSLVESLREGRIHAAIVGAGFAPPECIRIPLYGEAMVLISSLNYPRIDLVNQIANEIFLVCKKESACTRHLAMLFMEGGFQPARISECGSFSILMSSVVRGMGIALVPLSAVLGSAHEKQVLIHPLSGHFSTFQVEFVCPQPKGRPILERLIEKISQEFVVQKPN